MSLGGADGPRISASKSVACEGEGRSKPSLIGDSEGVSLSIQINSASARDCGHNRIVEGYVILTSARLLLGEENQLSKPSISD